MDHNLSSRAYRQQKKDLLVKILFIISPRFQRSMLSKIQSAPSCSEFPPWFQRSMLEIDAIKNSIRPLLFIISPPVPRSMLSKIQSDPSPLGVFQMVFENTQFDFTQKNIWTCHFFQNFSPAPRYIKIQFDPSPSLLLCSVFFKWSQKISNSSFYRQIFEHWHILFRISPRFQK